MIRYAIANPLIILVTAAIGFAAARLMNHDPHARDMIIAAVVLLMASELALIPLRLSSGATQAPVSQAALVATGIHMLVALASGFAISSAMHLSQPFLYWLCVFYWMTLIVVSTAGVKAVRSAPMEAPSK